MRILGLDPANLCGWAHSNGSHGEWLLKHKSDKHPGRRLERLRRFLFSCKREHGIDAIAFENASFGSHHINTQSLHNEVRGIILLCAAEWDVPVESYVPSHLKKWLTGDGKSSKEGMIRAVSLRFGVTTKSDNVADAITVMERSKQDFNGVRK